MEQQTKELGPVKGILIGLVVVAPFWALVYWLASR